MMKYFFEMNESDPAVQRAISGKAHKKRKLPQEFEGKDKVLIYRVGTESIDEAPAQVIWTTNKGLAFWMYDEKSKHGSHVYQAEIDPKDILSYETSRYRFKVNQYMSVRNVSDITEEAINDDDYLAQEFEDDWWEW